MKQHDLSGQDRAILELLQRDATLTHQSIAERVATSAATVWRRIQALEDAGYLTARVALVDPHRAGLRTTVMTEVTLRSHAAENRAMFERLVTTAPEIMECYSVSGQHDYRMLIRVRDIEAYEQFLMDVLLASPAVAGAETSFVLRQIKYTTAIPM